MSPPRQLPLIGREKISSRVSLVLTASSMLWYYVAVPKLWAFSTNARWIRITLFIEGSVNHFFEQLVASVNNGRAAMSSVSPEASLSLRSFSSYFHFMIMVPHGQRTTCFNLATQAPAGLLLS